MPGADHNYKMIFNIKKVSQKNKNVFLLKSLGHDYYFSICRIIDFMIGNSSSGIIEMPSFSKPPSILETDSWEEYRLSQC